MKYDDFVVQLGSGSNGDMEIRVSCLRGGEASCRFSLPWPPAQIASYLPTALRSGIQRDLGTVQSASSPSMSASGLGQILFDAVFREGVRGVFERSLGSLTGVQGQGLRIKLRMDLSNEAQATLHSLPWELLYRSETGEFLGLSRLSPIVRYLEAPQPIRPQPLSEVFRILVVAPEPRGQQPLNLVAERRNFESLRQRLKDFDVQFLHPPTLSELRDALLEREFHALHFMGHGAFDPRAGEGILFMEDRNGGADAVSAQAFVTILKDFQSLRLVVLNACRTGAGAEHNPFSGLAPALMRAGFPAVLAMQHPISDGAAITFSEAFYRRLGAGDPADTAVSEGRLAVYNRDRSSAEWSIPALFLRVPDGVIFKTEKATYPNSSQRATWRGHLVAGNYEDASRESRQARALDPEDALAKVGLAISLSRGGSLRSLPYGTAVEMHRILSECLLKADSRGLAAACLIALKLDYFQRNSVREMPPSLEDVLRLAAQSPVPKDGQELLRTFQMSDRARDALARINL